MCARDAGRQCVAQALACAHRRQAADRQYVAQRLAPVVTKLSGSLAFTYRPRVTVGALSEAGERAGWLAPLSVSQRGLVSMAELDALLCDSRESWLPHSAPCCSQSGAPIVPTQRWIPSQVRHSLAPSLPRLVLNPLMGQAQRT